MRMRRFPYTHRGVLISAWLIGILLAGPTGCTNFDVAGTSVDSTNPFGFLVNSNPASKTLGGVRLQNGSAVWAFGDFNADGSIRNISGAVLRDAKGDVTQITFEGGLPRKAKGPDGSTIEVTYTERTQTRLAGDVQLFFAGLPESDAHQTIHFAIDLEQAAAQLAQQIEQLTGLDVYDEPPPPKPKDTGDRSLLGDLAGTDALQGKDAAASQLILLLWGPTYVYLFASLGYALVQLMAQVVEAVIAAYVGVIVALTQAMVIAIAAPFILLGEVLRQAATQPLALLNLTLIQQNGHLFIPPAPDL